MRGVWSASGAVPCCREVLAGQSGGHGNCVLGPSVMVAPNKARQPYTVCQGHEV
jgi:hypothetical protein